MQVQAGGVWGPELSQEPRGAGLGWFLCWVRLGLPVPSEAPRAAPPRRGALVSPAVSSERGVQGIQKLVPSLYCHFFSIIFMCLAAPGLSYGAQNV